MTCAACTVTLKAAVKKLDGIRKVTASVEDKNAVVTFDVSKTNSEAVKSKIDSTGYKATVKQCKA
jgi:mercuric ion binding protein